MEILEETPDLASLEILRRVREAGYQEGKTALYDLVASLRPKPTKPLVRFEDLPGEFSQHDFGEVEVEFLNGTRQHILSSVSGEESGQFPCPACPVTLTTRCASAPPHVREESGCVLVLPASTADRESIE